MKAADKFYNPTTRVNQLWQIDFTYMKITGWGWYYLCTVLDDYSRYIVACNLCKTMEAQDAIDVVGKALGNAKLENKPNDLKILSDNGSHFTASVFRNYLSDNNIKYANGKPYHPMTQGKIERYHRTMKNIILLEHDQFPWQLKNRIDQFVNYYNKKRVHEAINNLTPEQVWKGQQHKILNERNLIKNNTIKIRKNLHYQKINAL